MVGNCVGESRRYSRSPETRADGRCSTKKEGHLAKFKIIPRGIARFANVLRECFTTRSIEKWRGKRKERIARNKKIEAVSFELFLPLFYSFVRFSFFFLLARFRAS